MGAFDWLLQMEKLDINGKPLPVYSWKKPLLKWDCCTLRKVMKAELPSSDYDNATYLTDRNEGSCILYLCKFLDEQKNVSHEVNHQT
jgi:hypothetical protein